jgi:hypothetical protein
VKSRSLELNPWNLVPHGLRWDALALAAVALFLTTITPPKKKQFCFTMPQDKRAVQYHPTASCMKSNISRMKKQLHDYSRETCLRVKPENQAIKQRMEFSEFSHF